MGRGGRTIQSDEDVDALHDYAEEAKHVGGGRIGGWDNVGAAVRGAVGALWERCDSHREDTYKEDGGQHDG